MQSEMINCGIPYEEGDAVLDASTIVSTDANHSPITGMVRDRLDCHVFYVDNDLMNIPFKPREFAQMLDLLGEVDSIHASLERENEKLRGKVANQRKQLAEVQHALELRNNDVLKSRWLKKLDKVMSELDRVREERDAMAAAMNATDDERHDFAPESHYMLLPKDADGKPIHVGDVMEWYNSDDTLRVAGVGEDLLFYFDDETHEVAWGTVRNKRHRQSDSWERIIDDALGMEHSSEYDRDQLVARCKALYGGVS